MPVTTSVSTRDIRRIALLRPRFIGDVCLTLPALDAIRAACPEARIAYVVEEESAALLAHDPRVDELIVTPRRPGALGGALAVAKLQRFGPQVAFDFFCNPRTALWTWLSGARVRVGYPHKGWRSALYTHHARPRTLSATGFHLASLAAVGWPAPGGMPRLAIPEPARDEARVALAELGVDPDATRVGFHPGARWPTRRWDPHSFVELIRKLLDARRDAVALVTAGPGEVDGARAIARPFGARARVIAGWPLGRFVALQSLCAAFVAGDTGPMHTAVAAGTPTLGLLSRNRPAMFFPYDPALGHRAYWARAECSPCHRDTCADLRCLRRLTPDGAWRLLGTMLAREAQPALVEIAG